MTTCSPEPPDAVGPFLVLMVALRLVCNNMSAEDGGRFNDSSPLQYFSGGQTRLLICPTEDCTNLQERHNYYF